MFVLIWFRFVFSRLRGIITKKDILRHIQQMSSHNTETTYYDNWNLFFFSYLVLITVRSCNSLSFAWTISYSFYFLPFATKELKLNYHEISINWNQLSFVFFFCVQFISCVYLYLQSSRRNYYFLFCSTFLSYQCLLFSYIYRYLHVCVSF